MDPLSLHLFSLIFIFNALHPEASSWTINVPARVKGLPGSCVVIPCTFNYPNTERTITRFTGMWLDQDSHPIFHSVSSKIIQKYRGRTQLLGDITQRNCSLKISPLQQDDEGPFHFRIEIQGYENYSYKANSVAVKMIDSLPPISFSIREEVEAQPASATCSVTHYCLTSMPFFNWSHTGEQQQQQRYLGDNQWEAMSTLTFHPTPADNNKNLLCNVHYQGGRHHSASGVMKVKYAPLRVEVESKTTVKEGETVKLKCTSDANPPANYEWHSDKGTQLHKGNVYTLTNISRHTGALYCTAVNKIGRKKSGAVQLNLLYGPEIKAFSSCSSEGGSVKCVCMADSKPPSNLQFLLPDRVLPSKVERHGPITIGTLQADASSFSFVYCVVNNTLGTANTTLVLATNNKVRNLYIVIGVGAGVIVAAVLIMGVKKCRGHSEEVPGSHMTTLTSDKFQKDSTQPRYDPYDDTRPSNLDDHMYGNMEGCCSMDDAIYANV